jgi:hypothetical protein
MPGGPGGGGTEAQTPAGRLLRGAARAQHDLQRPQLRPGHRQLPALGQSPGPAPGHAGERRHGRRHQQLRRGREPGVDDALGRSESRGPGEERAQPGGHRLELRYAGGERLGQLGAGPRQVGGAQGLGAAGPVADVGVRPARAEAAHVAADRLLRGEEGVGEGQVHPPQQRRVAGGVGPPAVVGAAHPPVHRPHPRALPLGEFRRAERRHHQPAGGAGQALPGVRAVVRVLLHAGERQRVRGLAEQRGHPADERGEVTVHPPDDAVGVEPPRAPADVSDRPHPRRDAGRIAGDPGAEGGAGAGEQGSGEIGEGMHPAQTALSSRCSPSRA